VQTQTNTREQNPAVATGGQALEPEWKLFLRRLLIMNIGLLVMSFGMVLTIEADMGASPWDVLHLGVTLHLPISFGTASQLVGLVVLIAACWMAKRVPTIGCLINIAMVGLYCDMLFGLVPQPEFWLWKLVEFMVGVAICGFGAGAYISSKLGAGPRDWLMLSIHQKTGWSIKWVRTGIEVSAVVLGILLGGPFSIGTILFSLTVGHPTEWGLKWSERIVRSFVERRVVAG
jgi:uncharacterized membrane protein YczE